MLVLGFHIPTEQRWMHTPTHMQMKEKYIQESEVIENTFELMLLTLYKTVLLVRLQKKSNYHLHFSKMWYFGKIFESDKMFHEFSGIRQQSEQPAGTICLPKPGQWKGMMMMMG